ncbi:MAG: hypothetical protein ACM35G_05895, partial [Planctomycetaceae bacterium]
MASVASADTTSLVPSGSPGGSTTSTASAAWGRASNVFAEGHEHQGERAGRLRQHDAEGAERLAGLIEVAGLARSGGQGDEVADRHAV